MKHYTEFDEKIDNIINNLPSGSGLNYKWEFTKELKNGTLIFDTYYQPMNEVGYYMDSVPVRLRIYKNNDWKLNKINEDRSYLYGLNDYLEDTFIYSMEQLFA